MGVATGGDEGFDGGGLGGGGGGVEGGRGDVIAVLVEGWVVEGGIPVAALPAADSVAEDIGKIVVVSARSISKCFNNYSFLYIST